MDNKKHIVNLESFKEMLHICPRLPHQPFVEPLFEEEILAFLCFLGHSAVIRKLTDVEHKDTKKSNEMYYPRFTKIIIHHFMSKDPSIPRRNNVNWHYVRDDHMFSTIKLVSRQNMQQFGALLPIELTNEDIRNSNAYKEYYAVATGVTLPKPKASVRKTISSSDITITPPTAAAGPRLTTSEKGKQAAKASKAKSDDDDDQEDDGDDDEDDEEKGGDDEQASDEEEFIHPSLSIHAEEEPRDEESFDPIPKTPEDTDDEVNENDEFLKTIDENMQKIIKEQVKEQVKVQVSKILLTIEQTVNEQLEAEVLTRSSNSSKTSYAIVADLSKMELKKILIEKMEGNKSIHQSNEQRNLYKALVEAYESDKIILDTY
nr:hypothetical protein [Tanacetum cinerariifolium]